MTTRSISRRARGSGRTLVVLLAVALLVPTVGAGALTTGTVERVSVSSSGSQAAGGTQYGPEISSDGRFVAFASGSADLVAGDTNGLPDVFVHDRQTGATTRVSTRSSGAEAVGGDSASPSISADGRFVAFSSSATNLVAGDTNGLTDVFVHDRQTASTTRVSVHSAGDQTIGGNSLSPAISGDGRYVAFISRATNLVAGDTNGDIDVFVHDRQTGATGRVSVDSDGDEAVGGDSYLPDISADGGSVAFVSEATNLVAADTNGLPDVFVHDRQTGATTRASVHSNGAQAVGGDSYYPSLSGDGRYVAFTSQANNLVEDDANGWDAFVHDQQTGTTELVSVASDGTQANGSNYLATITADGRYVAFDGWSTNLVPDDTNGVEDVFVHDRQSGDTIRVSVTSTGAQTNGTAEGPMISADGRHVAFTSNAPDIVAGDTNSTYDAFVWSAATVPGAPTSVSATGGDGEATVSWSAPADDGDSPITGYTVTASPGGATTTVGGGRTSATIAGLRNGTAYTFTVVATNVVGDSPPSAPSNTVVPAPVGLVRQSGGDRIETAVAISKATFDPGVATVYLATALDFPDALAGGPRAAADGAPILLTFPDRLPQATADELTRLAPAEVVILGGPVAVHTGVADEVDALGGWDVDRLFGGDRYATAAAVADTFGPVDRVLVATGREFPDALAGGVLAAPDAPILLTERDRLPAATREAISDLAPDEIVLLGGTVAVGDAVASELSAMVGGDLERLWGPDRFATAAAISEEFPAPRPVVYVATGLAFPDALAGVPAAARYDAPLLLVRPDELPQATIDALQRLRPAGVVVLGGPTAVSAEVALQLETYLSTP